MERKFYYDLEFLEGTQSKKLLGIKYGNTKFMLEPISIGIIDEYDREYFAVFNDFNLEEAWNRYDLKPDIDNGGMKKVYWIRENVLKPLHKKLCSYVGIYGKTYYYNLFEPFTLNSMKNLLKWYGKNKRQVAQEIKNFVTPEWYWSDGLGELPNSRLEDNPIKLLGYYSSYDHVCLCSIFGKMIDLPKGFPFYTYDLKQLEDEKFNQFNKIEIELIKEGKILINELSYPKNNNEHDCLSDAKFNKELEYFLNNIL